MKEKIILTDNSRTTVIIRVMVGLVFVSEGIQKFLFPAIRGVGRFEKIGMPMPEFLGYFVASWEIIAGFFILIGFITRGASAITFIIMVVAIITTKLDILADKGIWEMLHASRTDWSMLLGSLFLILKGGGHWSVDKSLTDKYRHYRY